MAVEHNNVPGRPTPNHYGGSPDSEPLHDDTEGARSTPSPDNSSTIGKADLSLYNQFANNLTRQGFHDAARAVAAEVKEIDVSVTGDFGHLTAAARKISDSLRAANENPNADQPQVDLSTDIPTNTNPTDLRPHLASDAPLIAKRERELEAMLAAQQGSRIPVPAHAEPKGAAYPSERYALNLKEEISAGEFTLGIEKQVDDTTGIDYSNPTHPVVRDDAWLAEHASGGVRGSRKAYRPDTDNSHPDAPDDAKKKTDHSQSKADAHANSEGVGPLGNPNTEDEVKKPIKATAEVISVTPNTPNEEKEDTSLERAPRALPSAKEGVKTDGSAPDAVGEFGTDRPESGSVDAPEANVDKVDRVDDVKAVTNAEDAPDRPGGDRADAVDAIRGEDSEVPDIDAVVDRLQKVVDEDQVRIASLGPKPTGSYEEQWGDLTRKEIEEKNRQYARHREEDVTTKEVARNLTADILVKTGKDKLARDMDGRIRKNYHKTSEEGVKVAKDLEAVEEKLLGQVANAADVVDQAYAKGEIDEKEYKTHRSRVEAEARDAIVDQVKQATGSAKVPRYYRYNEPVSIENAADALMQSAVKDPEGFAQRANDAGLDPETARHVVKATSGDNMTDIQDDHRQGWKDHDLANAIVRGEAKGRLVLERIPTLDGHEVRVVAKPYLPKDAHQQAEQIARIRAEVRANLKPGDTGRGYREKINAALAEIRQSERNSGRTNDTNGNQDNSPGASAKAEQNTSSNTSTQGEPSTPSRSGADNQDQNTAANDSKKKDDKPPTIVTLGSEHVVWGEPRPIPPRMDKHDTRVYDHTPSGKPNKDLITHREREDVQRAARNDRDKVDAAARDLAHNRSAEPRYITSTGGRVYEDPRELDKRLQFADDKLEPREKTESPTSQEKEDK